MPPKKRKFESTFPAARIKKIMQLDDDVGRVASSVPVVISRAVEIFLHALLTRADDYAMSRNARTLSVAHLKHCIEQEKQWDFLKELTAKIPDVSADVEESDDPPPSKRGRKRHVSPGRAKAPPTKRKQKSKAIHVVQEEEEESESESGTPEPTAASTRLISSAAKSTTGSSLATTSSSIGTQTMHVDLGGVLEQYKQQLSTSSSTSGSGPLSIPALIAAGSASSKKRQEDSDDDYD